MSRANFVVSGVILFLSGVSSASAQSYNPYNRGGGGQTGGGFLYPGGSVYPLISPGYFGPTVTFIPFGPIRAPYATPFGTALAPSSPYQSKMSSGSFGYDPYGGVIRGGTAARRYSGGFSTEAPSEGISRFVDPVPKEKKADAPRRIFDEWQIDRGQRVLLPEESRLEALARSLNGPPMSEVLSGESLNAILAVLETRLGKLPKIDPIPVDEAILKQINFAKGTNHGNFGLLKDAGKIVWPKGLKELADPEAKTIREEAEKVFGEAYQQATQGKVDADKLKSLESLDRRLEDLISTNVSKLGFDQHREAKRFARAFSDTVAFLKQPDVQSWLPGSHAFENKTIQEIVILMSEKGLRFAPAVSGSEKSYVAVHNALVKYYLAAGQVIEKK